MLAVVLIVWRTAVALKLAAVARMAWSGVGRRFPFVLGWLALAASRSLVLMAGVWPRHDVFAVTAPILMAAEFCATVEVFREATKRHAFGRAGSWILATAALLGVAASLASRLVLDTPKPYGIAWMSLADRHGSLVMLAVLAVTLGLLQHFRREIPVDRPAFRAVVLLLAYAVGGFVFSSLNVATGYRYPALTNLLPVAFDGLLSAAWASWFLAARQAAPKPIKTPERAGMLLGAARMDQREIELRKAVVAMR